MKRVRIKEHLSKTIEDFLNSITDTSLREDMQRDLIITGGAINSLLLDEKVNDYDIYFKTQETTLKVCKYFISKWSGNLDTPVVDLGEVSGEDDYTANKMFTYDAPDRMHLITYEYEGESRLGIYAGHWGGMEINEDNKAVDVTPESGLGVNWGEAQQSYKSETFDEKAKYRPKYFSCNAITLSDKIQLITRFWGQPEDIHKNFDFVHVKNWWTPRGGLVLKQDALECLLTKELVYTGSKYPIASIIRTRKYIKRGWSITAGQYLKMAFQISDLDLYNLYTLREQLTGIDAVYFEMLIRELSKPGKQAELADNPNCIFAIIDRVLEKDFTVEEEIKDLT